MYATTSEGNAVNNLLDLASRNRRENNRDAPRATVTLTPFYQRLTIINALLSGAWLVLGLVAAARGR